MSCQTREDFECCLLDVIFDRERDGAPLPSWVPATLGQLERGEEISDAATAIALSAYGLDVS